jgi:pimeloyl-ACP methyl ester carboxylesterase
MKKIHVLSLFLVVNLLWSCTDQTNKKKATPQQKIKVENDGVNIVYDDSGDGDTTLLFIHGWAINKSYWKLQTDYFSKKYRVIAVDLPGYGQSGKNRKNWTVEMFCNDMTILISQLNLKNVIVIGHSMSGAIALETALKNPSTVIGIIGIDNFKNYGFVQTPQEKEQMKEAFIAMRSDFKNTVRPYIKRVLLAPSTDSLLKEKILNDMLSGDSVIAVDCIEQMDTYPLDEKLRTLGKPLFLINSDFISTDTLSLIKDKIKYHLYNIGSTGHYPMIEKPDDFNLLLQLAIEKIKD